MKFKYGDKVEYTGDIYPHLKGTYGVVVSGGTVYNRSGVVKEHVEVVFDQNTSIFLHDTELNDLSLSQTFKHTNLSQRPATPKPSVYPTRKFISPYDYLDKAGIQASFSMDTRNLKDTFHIHKRKTYVGLTGLNQYDYCEECGERL